MTSGDWKEYGERVDRLRRAMVQGRVDAVILVPGSNFTYFTGLFIQPSERLMAFVVQPERCALIHPSFEESRLAGSACYAACDPGIAWQETENPYVHLAGLLGGSRRVALDPVMPFWQFERIRGAGEPAEWINAGAMVEALRILKSPWELDRIRRACRITARAMEALFERMSAAHGAIDPEQQRVLLTADFAREGSVAAEALLQFDAGSADPHGQASGQVTNPYVALLDCGANVDGYWADLTRTRCLRPEAARDFSAVESVVREAHDAAISAVREGVPASSIDRAARSVIEKAGYGPYFTHRVGHGLGLEVHEPPYLSGDNDLILKAGMVVTVEPGIYLPGRYGVRLEDDVVVTAAGADVLSA